MDKTKTKAVKENTSISFMLSGSVLFNIAVAYQFMTSLYKLKESVSNLGK